MPSGARHFTGSSKRVEAHPKSSNLVVNSVALSRDLPVFTGFFEIIRVVAENNIDKDDVFYVCGHCFRSISSLNQVLFAINKEYCINEKKAVKMIEDFKIKPSDYKERVDKVISLISTDVDCTRKGIEILQRLVNEVEYLKGVHIQ